MVLGLKKAVDIKFMNPALLSYNKLRCPIETHIAPELNIAYIWYSFEVCNICTRMCILIIYLHFDDILPRKIGFPSLINNSGSQNIT